MDLIEQTVAAGATPTAARKWWMAELSRRANEAGVELSALGVAPQDVAATQAMVDAGELTELSEGSEAFSVNLSAEQADSLDADVMFFYATDQAEAETVTSHALVSSIPAVESGAYVAVDDMPLMAALTSPTPLTIPVVLEEFLPLAAEAAAAAR